MNIVRVCARALALALSVGSLSLAFGGEGSLPIVRGAAAMAPSPATVAPTEQLARDDLAASKRRRARAAQERARTIARARAERVRKARAARVRAARLRAARIRAERLRIARLPWQKRLGFRWPAQGWITSGMGARGKGYHHGTDIACRKGSLIRASKAGRVVFVKHMKIYGKTVVIQHAHGYSTLYAHMQRIHTRVGRVVRTQQIIGRCGSTGRSTGPHLHFELRRNGRFLKPGHYLR